MNEEDIGKPNASDQSDEPLYDEFGNYIGPELDSSSDDDSSSDEDEDVESLGSSSAASPQQQQQQQQQEEEIGEEEEEMGAPSSAIVLHEDKVHYPSAAEVYGPDVVTAVLDEDAMDIETPILAPATAKPVQFLQEENEEETVQVKGGSSSDQQQQQPLVSDEYLVNVLMKNERTHRGVALIGDLHTGKTSLCDLLLEHGHSNIEDNTFCGKRITDTSLAEQQRGLSIKSCPLTLALPDLRGKSHALTLMDCPGNSQFHEESVAALKAMDGAIIVVDALEGMTLHTELLLRQCLQVEGLPLTLLINKLDRLWMEVLLPPDDTYYKIRHTIDTINQFIHNNHRLYSPKKDYFHPAKGNVAFACPLHGYCFTLESFAQTYLDHLQYSDNDDDDVVVDNEVDYDNLGKNLTSDEFAKRLWGNAFLDPETGNFVKSRPKGVKRTFVQFILEPLYKLYTACLGESQDTVNKILRSLGILLSKDQLRASTKPLLRSTMRRFFGPSTGLMDMIVKFIPSPKAAAKGKVHRCYTGALDSLVAKSMMECNTNGPLMIHVVKLYPASDGQSFSAFGRIYSGTIKPGDKIKVLGEAYSPQDDEDMATAIVSTISIPRGRRRTEVSMASAGSWVLLDGLDSYITKTATITSASDSNDDDNDIDDEIEIFAPLKFPQVGGESIMKLAVEPLNPAELPKMVEGLRRISKAYPMAKTRVEESGEHVLFGTGELYMDCVMHDLRHVYSDIEVKVADPVVAFRETVVETSSIKCFAETANKRNKLTMISEPLDEGLAEILEAGKVDLQNWDQKKVGRFFQNKYQWDLLSARSVWAFGDSPTHGTNILMDDTLPGEVDKSMLNFCKSSIVQGFQWATREGPLCEEPLRSTKLKILDATLADKPIHRGGGQIIPTARKVVHSSLLTATPRLMEPVYRLQINCPQDIVGALQPILKKRRGHIVEDTPIAASPFSAVKAYIPVIDSFGFETDIRIFTQGQAIVHSVFDHWAIVPGDPLDRNIILHPLEPSPPHHLAREFMIKTRRRKGLSEDVSITKFFDESMREQLEKDEGEILPMAN